MMERLTCEYEKMSALRDLCTFDKNNECIDCASCGACCEENLPGDCVTCPIQTAFDKLAEYEDAEEQGLLLRLPCHVGDPVYRIMGDGFIMKSIVEEFVFTNTVYVIVRDELFNARRGIEYCEMGRTMFLTREEAEAALKKMQEGKNE